HPSPHSFPTRRSSDLGDQREKIAGIKKKAKAYAKQETSTVEMLLLTKGIEANRNGVKVGAMSVTFSFSLPRKASSALDREGLARSEEHTSELQSRFDL